MKRKLVIAAIVIGLLSLVIYIVPIAIASSKSRPLYGNFDMGMKCVGGHEIFLYLDEDEAFEHCPGHRDMSLLGRIERNADSVIIHWEHDDAPWCRVDFDGADNTLVIFNDSSRHDLPQVNNPWRTWLPQLLPEH